VLGAEVEEALLVLGGELAEEGFGFHRGMGLGIGVAG
jgi:hypothetical protein